jgi:SlyX protein
MMESRLTELEIKISFTEDQLEELNKVVYRQQQQIDLLIGEVRALRDQVVNNDQPQEQRNLRDEIPPHY